MNTTLNLEPMLLCKALDSLHRAMEQRQTDALMAALDAANQLVERSKRLTTEIDNAEHNNDTRLDSYRDDHA